MSKIKIGILTYTVSFGGVGTFIISLAETLRTRGFDVTVISTDKKGIWLEKLKGKLIPVYHYDFGILGWIPFGRIIHALSVGKKIQNQNFDIVLNNHSYFAQISAGFYKPPAKLISILHNQHLPVVKSGCINKNALDAVVCVGPKVYDNAIKFLSEKKVEVILNGVKLPTLSDIEQRKRTNDTLKVLFVGRFEHQQKGILLIPEIIQEVLNSGVKVEFTLVGDGSDRDLFLQELERLNLKSYINYKGLLTSEEVYKLYLTHHVLLLPSYYEGLPLTLIEAMGAGCVPVVSNLPGSTDICVENGESGYLVKVGDVIAFSKSIILLSKEYSIWEKMSERSITIANKKFSIDTMVDNYVELFQRVLQYNNKSNNNWIFLDKNWWKEIVPFNLVMFSKKVFKKF